MRCLAPLAILLGLVADPGTAGEVPREPRERVAHHVRHAEAIATHFEEIRERGCPRFRTREEWQAYIDGEVDQLVSLLAHLEQAWAEALATGDDDVRRAAKTPRRRVDGAQALVDKLQSCALDHGTHLQPGPIWARIQRDLPRRRAEIALP